VLDSIRTRLTLWYVSLLGLVLIAFSVGVYILLARNLGDRMDGELRSALEATAVLIINERAEGESDAVAAKTAISELYLPRQAVALFDTRGQLIAEKVAPNNLHAILPPRMEAAGDVVQYLTLPEEGGQRDDGQRVAIRQVKIPPSQTVYLIVASQSLETVDESLELLRGIFWIVIPAALCLAGLGGRLLARKSLAPVVAMSNRTRRLSARNLSERLPVSNPRDELGHLANTFNDLLARLETSFSQQRQFMADASHELRTPLSVLRAASSITLEKSHREEQEYREAFAIMAEQTSRLTRIVEDMFTLARADAGERILRPTRFYLDELLHEAVRAAGVLADRKQVTIKISAAPETLLQGDEGLIRQMLLNLLDNAVKYTPPRGMVDAELKSHDSRIVITISDTGSGIPDEIQPRIFDRFFRHDKARSRTESAAGSGAGLGLSIARWIAEAHQGQLELVHSDQNGSTFQITLPRQ
jgi:heavy metal sensor kinase